MFWQVIRPKWKVRIVVADCFVQSMEGVALAQQPKLKHFRENDVSLSGRITIHALRHPNGRFDIRFSGPIDDGVRQRIRNFFVASL